MSVYEYVNEKLFAIMDKGTIPWEAPWRMSRFSNPISGTVYKGINILLAGLFYMTNDFHSPYFVTMKQANGLQHQVIKGEGKNYCMIVKYFFDDRFNEKGVKIGTKFKGLRYFKLYNIEQTTIPNNFFTQTDKPFSVNPFEFQFGYETGPIVKYDKIGESFYNKTKDEIHLPREDEFKTAQGLKDTLFHELAHSTMIDSRLNRNFSHAKEELVAEIASAFMMHEMGLEVNYDNSGAYLRNWRDCCEKEPTLLVTAANAAEKAVKYIIERPMQTAVAV